MPRTHLIRVGAFALVGRFAPADATIYPRGARVIVRTARGLEVGEVLADEEPQGRPPSIDGALVRGMTVEDELLAARMERSKRQALDSCQQRLRELDVPLSLIDAETLFDGRGIFFYFLGDASGRLDALTEELATAYDAQVQFKAFTDTLAHGCGPDCGTEGVAGQGCGSCETGCAVRDSSRTVPEEPIQARSASE